MTKLKNFATASARFWFLGGIQWSLILAIFLVVWFEYGGFFTPPPQHVIEILHSWHIFWLSVVLAAFTVARFVMGVGSKIGLPRLLVHISIFLFCTAIWTSRETHFEGKSIRFEGQGMQGLMGDYVQPSVYGRSRKMPSLGFHVNKLRPETDSSVSRLRKVAADITLSTSSSLTIKDTTISSRFPLFTAGTFVLMTDFGYATRFSMSDLAGNQVDSDYQYLKLFPPGAEDSFVPFTYGYSIFLRLYPDYRDKGGIPSSVSAEPRNPLFKVRIVRHKDIIYNDFMKIGEHLKFDDAIFQLHDVVKWAEFTLVKDRGIFVAAAAVLCLVISGILAILPGRGHTNDVTGMR